MFSDRVLDSLRVICIAVGAASIVLILIGLATVAFGAAPQDEYVLMSRETFEMVLKALKTCQGARI